MSTALLLVAAASPAPTSLGNPGDNPNHVGPGAVAFWIVIALGVGLFLLVKSMGRQMKRIHFDDGSEPPAGATGTGPSSGRKPSARKVPAGKVPAGKVPAGKVPAGKVPAGKVPAERPARDRARRPGR